MPFSPAQVANDEQPIFVANTTLITDLTNVAASATAYWYFRVPYACEITRLHVTYLAEAGTGPALTVAVRSGSTAIIQAQATTAATPVEATAAESGQSLERQAGEIMNVALTSANADNDFTGLCVVLYAKRRYE